MLAILWIFAAVAQDAAGQNTDSVQPRLVLFTDENPPISFFNPETALIEGTVVHVVREVLKSADVSYDMKILPWNRAFRQAQAEPNTCVFPVAHAEERARMFQWVSPIAVGGWAVFQRPDSDFKITKLEDLKPYTVAGLVGSVIVEEFERIVGNQAIHVIDDKTGAEILYRKRIDFWITGLQSGPVAAKYAGYPEPKLALNWKPSTVGIACSFGTDSTLIDKLNKANQERLMNESKGGGAQDQ